MIKGGDRKRTSNVPFCLILRFPLHTIHKVGGALFRLLKFEFYLQSSVLMNLLSNYDGRSCHLNSFFLLKAEKKTV